MFAFLNRRCRLDKMAGLISDTVILHLPFSKSYNKIDFPPLAAQQSHTAGFTAISVQ